MHSSGDLADQRADHVTPHVEISPELPVALRTQARLLDVRLGGLEAGRFEHRADQLGNALAHALTIHVGGARPREAVVAEAHSQQVADVWTQRDEAALVVIAVVEWHVRGRFELDRIRSIATHIAGERGGEGAHARVGGAQRIQQRVAEYGHRCALRCLKRQPAVVQHHHPDRHAHAATPAALHQGSQRILCLRDRRHVRLQSRLDVTTQVRAEVDRAALQVSHLAAWVVREDVA